MDAPPIQYARTDDGVNIAYSVSGDGPTIVRMPEPFSHHEREWDIPEIRNWLEGLGRGRRLVRYDARGQGLSQSDAEEFTLESELRDFQAVRDQLPQEPLILQGNAWRIPAAIAYTAAHPEDVRALVLWDPDSWNMGADHPLFAGWLAQLDLDWDLFREMFSRSLIEPGTPLQISWRDMIADTSPELARQSLANRLVDPDAMASLCRSIQTPTLILFRRGHPTLGGAREIASLIPKAQMIGVDGPNPPMWAGDVGPVHAAIDAFLEEVRAAQPIAAGLASSAFRTLLFTDLESSTALTQALGDAKAQEVLHGHNEAVRAALAAHDGEEVKHTGDGIFAAFGSAVSAVKAALQIQRDLAGAEVRVRIGLNAGEPIAEDDDYFGTAVQLAARVCDRAEPGQVLVSRVVHDLCAGKGFAFTEQGEATLKGFPEPVRLFVVGGD